MRALTIILIFISYTATAQWSVGGRAGISFSNYKTKTPWKEVANIGMAFSLQAYNQIRPNTGLTIQLEYIQKGYYHKICNTIYDRLTANYLEIPVTVNYTLIVPTIKNFKGHLGLGLYGAYWLNGKYKTKGFESGDDTFDFTQQGFKRFDFGPSVSGRIEYVLKSGSLSLDVRYEMGLMDMQKRLNDNVTNTNRTLIIGLSYLKYL